MKACKNCHHFVRRIKGTLKHRMEHHKYSGVSSGGVTFGIRCLCLNLLDRCKCENPEELGDE